MTGIHQGAGQRACHATYEEAFGGYTPPSKPYYRSNGKMWDKKTKHSQHLARGIHQAGGSIEEEEVQDLPSCQRQTSKQLVFSVRPVCKEQKPVVVICEAC